MKKGLFFSGLALLLAGIVLSGVGRSMGGSATATAHFFGRDLNLYCSLPVLSVNPAGRVYAESTPIDQVTICDDPQPTHYFDEAEYAVVIEGSSDGWYGSEFYLTPFDSIEVDLDLGNVTIIGADFYGIDFTTSHADHRICYENEDNTLKIWDESTFPSLPISSDFTAEVTVYVPEGVMMDSLNVDVDLGSVYLCMFGAREAEITLDLGSLDSADFYTDGKLIVESSLGDVNLYGGFNGTTEINADFGDVQIYGDLTGDLNVDADLGDVFLYLSGNEGDYRWSLAVGMGNIWVDSRANSNSSLSGGSGSNVIDASADLGDINLYFDY